jgi:hypothetical protein
MHQLRRFAALAVASATAAATAQPGSIAHESPAPLPYSSVFEGYQPFAEQELIPWREANDNVGRIGGWRAYAREASEGSAPPAASTPAPARAPAPAASASPAPTAPASSAPAPASAAPRSGGKDPHAGHH